tara:strand:+ start:905 stop:1438 length:534 start_codon:yes stop_codon:yes gene_type:complete
MVKNTQGGGRTKGLARKHMNKGNQSNKLRLPVEEGEQIACVTKMFGNGMCEIYNNDNIKLIGHIRGSMRGRQKRHNKITSSMLVLIGLRTWESTLKNCDILCIYSDEEVEQLKTLPSVNITNVLSSRNNTIGVSKELFEDVDFENNDEDEELLVNKKDLKIEDFNLEQHDTIDLDDI